jgi:hypothetical protein
MRWRIAGVGLLVAVAGTFAAIAIAASITATTAQLKEGQPKEVGNPTIRKVIFGGNPAHPEITVTGSDLTYHRSLSATPPDPNPPYTPGSHPLCPHKLTGVQGHDYGTRLYLVNTSAHQPWSAGRYRPGLNELDCIGIVIEQWTSSAIEFRFGSGYLQGHYQQLHNGDYVQIVWNHLSVGVRVKYGPDGVTSRAASVT